MKIFIQIGVLAVHLHHLIIEKPIFLIKETSHQAISIDTFRICVNAYVFSRYSKTVRIYSNENRARFDQTMQMLLRVRRRSFDCLTKFKFCFFLHWDLW